MATRHLSLLEQKKMQWAKEREELAGLGTPWGPTDKVRPLRKRLAPNLPEDPNEEYQSRDDVSTISVVPPLKEIHPNNQAQNVPVYSRGRTPRGKNDPDSNSSNLPPMNLHIHAEDPRRMPSHRRDGISEKHEGYDGYIYLNNSSGLSKSTENFSTSESDPRVKRKPFLSGDRAPGMESYEKISADRSPYSSSYQLRNSNLSLATDGDATWREWGMGRGNVDEIRPRWGDRGINTGQPWNSGGPTPVGRICDNLGVSEEYPAPGWVERGLSRMSGDGRGRGSAESPRNDPGIRVVISDENGVHRLRGSLSELQNVTYVPVGRTSNEIYSQRNYDGYSSALPYVGEMPTIHSSAGVHQRHGGSVIEDGKGERVLIVERDECNPGDIVQSGRIYGYDGCISAPSNKPPSHKFKKNDDVTASLPNLQCTNTHLRGQNVPVDPEVIVEREMRRLKAMELQKAIRQQLEEREKIRQQEKERRMKEEREIEERLRQQQEAERLKKEEEERKHREKEEMENKKAEIMREALEAAEQDAQKQRKKRSVHKEEGNLPEAELSRGHNDYPGVIDSTEPNGNYVVSSCCPVLTEGAPNAGMGPTGGPGDEISGNMSLNMKLDGGMIPDGRLAADYREVPYHSSTTPVAPFKITIPESSLLSGPCDAGGDGGDLRQGGVLIVGRDVYLLPYVNTDVLAPRQLNGSNFTVASGGGIESIGNGILGPADHFDYRRDWISSTQRVRPSKDVGTQTEPTTQGPLLLLLRMAGPDDSQSGSEQRSGADDASSPDNEKDGKGKSFEEDVGTASNDCCFCQKTRSQTHPSCSKGQPQDCQQKQPQQLDQRPKWGANRPVRRYTTQSEKDPHYSCRNNGQKRQSVGRSKREVPDTLTTEEGSEDPEQGIKTQPCAKPKVDSQASTKNAPSTSASNRYPATRKKKESSKKRSEKTRETGESSQPTGQPSPQSPLPVLAPTKTVVPKRVQVVKPSLSLNQEIMGQTEYRTLDSPSSRAHLPYFSPQQFSPMQMFPDCKHLPPPILSPLQRSALSPTRFTQIPMVPIRLSPSPTPPIKPCLTPLPTVRSPHSSMASSRHTQTPLPMTPPPAQHPPAPQPPAPQPPAPQPPVPQPPLRSNRSCGSPPVPALLSKIRREQAKSPPRQFSFISTAPEKPSQPPPPSRKESRSGTPSLKPQTPSAKVPSPRVENKNTIVVITPSEETGKKSPVAKPLRPVTLPSVENSNFLPTPRDETSNASPSNVSCLSRSSARDNSNALMMVTSTEDISVGSPVPNQLLNSLSMVEVDENGSIVLVTPSDEISVGVDCRSNNSLSRASQLSAEGIPDGFWEDLESSARMSSSQADVSAATSIPEDGKKEQKMTEGASVVIMENEKGKQTESNEVGSNVKQPPKSPDNVILKHKAESVAKDVNNERKEICSGNEEGKNEMIEEIGEKKSEIKLAKNSNLPPLTAGDDHILESGIAYSNEDTPHQELKEVPEEQVGQENDSRTCHNSPRPGKDESKQKSSDRVGEEMSKGLGEKKPSDLPLEENNVISPDTKENREQEPVQDDIAKSATLPPDIENSVVNENDKIASSENVTPKGELIQDGSLITGDGVSEVDENVSSNEGKINVDDATKSEENIQSPLDVERIPLPNKKGHSPRNFKDETKLEEKEQSLRGANDRKGANSSLKNPDSSEEMKCKDDANSPEIKNKDHGEDEKNSSDCEDSKPENPKKEM